MKLGNWYIKWTGFKPKQLYIKLGNKVYGWGYEEYLSNEGN